MMGTKVAVLDNRLADNKGDEAHAEAQKNMGLAGLNGGKLVLKWDVNEVCNWLNVIGFGHLSAQFKQHAISGPALSKLNDGLLKEMGLDIVGHRILLIVEVVKIQAIARSEWRNTVIWASAEYRAGPCNGSLPYNFPCHFEACIGRPDMYTLTNAKFNIMRSKKSVNIPGFGCCGFQISSENIDLKDITDCDNNAATALMGDPPGQVILNSTTGNARLTLKSSECQKVTTIVMNAKEEAVIASGMAMMR
ncbi:hypothetical protein B484DRAFT_460299, partial [Ochromonadaceae sp. CCMP2298]